LAGSPDFLDCPAAATSREAHNASINFALQNVAILANADAVIKALASSAHGASAQG